MNNPSKNRCMDCLAHANPMLRDAVKAALRWAPPVLLALTASQAWAETLSVYGTDGKSGEINDAARSIRELAEHLDQRTAEITVGINKLTNNGARALSTIDKAAKNFDANPSRIIFGGPPPSDKDKDTKKK